MPNQAFNQMLGQMLRKPYSPLFREKRHSGFANKGEAWQKAPVKGLWAKEGKTHGGLSVDLRPNYRPIWKMALPHILPVPCSALRNQCLRRFTFLFLEGRWKNLLLLKRRQARACSRGFANCSICFAP